MNFKGIAVCTKCRQPIVWGEGWVYVCFKVPGNEGFELFHRRFRGADCWEDYLRESQQR